MVNPQPITRSTRTYGRYAIGNHELATGDVIEWIEGNVTRSGTVEYTYAGYFVRTTQGSIALRALVQSKRVGRVRPTKS